MRTSLVIIVQQSCAGSENQLDPRGTFQDRRGADALVSHRLDRADTLTYRSPDHDSLRLRME